MNFKNKRNAFTTLSDPNATEEQWTSALQEILPVASKTSITKRHTTNEFTATAELLVGFTAAVGLVLFTSLLFSLPDHSQHLGPLYTFITVLSGLMKDTKRPVWRGFSNGLILVSIALTMISMMRFPAQTFLNFWAIPAIFMAYFGPNKLRLLAGDCKHCKSTGDQNSTEKTVFSCDGEAIGNAEQSLSALGSSHYVNKENVAPLHIPDNPYLVAAKMLDQALSRDICDSLEEKSEKIRRIRYRQECD